MKYADMLKMALRRKLITHRTPANTKAGRQHIARTNKRGHIVPKKDDPTSWK